MTDERDYLQAVMGRITGSAEKRPSARLKQELSAARQALAGEGDDLEDILKVVQEQKERVLGLLLDTEQEREAAARPDEAPADTLSAALDEAFGDVLGTLLDGWLLLEDALEDRNPALLTAVSDRAEAADEALARLLEDIQELTAVLPGDGA